MNKASENTGFNAPFSRVKVGNSSLAGTLWGFFSSVKQNATNQILYQKTAQLGIFNSQAKVSHPAQYAFIDFP